MIKQFINDIGIKNNIFDENWYINENDLITNFNYAFENNMLFKKESKILYNISIFKNENSTTKQKLGYINSILANYCLKLSCKNKMKRYGYKIDILFHADEIIKRKLSRNNYTIFDNNKIFNCNKCDLMELY